MELILEDKCQNKDKKANRSSPEKRFAFSILKDDTLRKLIKHDWISRQYILSEVTGKTYYELKKGNFQDLQIRNIVDTIYDLFSHQIYDLCKTHFPVYDPETIKTKSFDNHIDSQCSTLNAIRIFKRSQRATAQNCKFKATGTDVVHEATEFYSSLYHEEFDSETLTRNIINDRSLNTWKTCGDEVHETLVKYSSAKASGPDGISTRLLKVLNEVKGFSDLIAELFNIFLEFSNTPSIWNISRIHLLMKDKDVPFVSNSRPISLTITLRRIFEKIILKKALKEQWSQLHPSQAGFRHGWSTLSHILLNDELSRGKGMISAYLDLKNAFDTVNHGYLVKILHDRKVPPHVIQLIQSLMLRNCKSSLEINGLVAASLIQRTRGLFQGSILSPFLFNLVIDTLAHDVTRILPQTTILLFADDIVIKTETWSEMQKAINICYSWSIKAKLKWGINKCGIVTGKDPFSIILGEEVLPQVNTYKYLGVPFTSKGVDWRSYTQKITEKSARFLKHIRAYSINWPIKLKIVIFKTFVRPISEYALPLLTRWITKQPDSDVLLKTLIESYIDGIQFIFGKRQPLTLLESLAGLGTYRFRILQLEASLARHLQELRPPNPLYTYMNQNSISDSRNFIISKCKSSELWKKWTHYKKMEKFPLKYNTWLKHEKYDDQTHQTGKLHRYIFHRCKNRSGMDNLLNQTGIILKNGILWRSNVAFSNTTCPICTRKFNRAHLLRCDLYSLLGIEFEDISVTKAFQADLEELKTQKLAENYTLLDYYLNNEDYILFQTIYDQVKAILC
jgi:hypothetical protein